MLRRLWEKWTRPNIVSWLIVWSASVSASVDVELYVCQQGEAGDWECWVNPVIRPEHLRHQPHSNAAPPPPRPPCDRQTCSEP